MTILNLPGMVPLCAWRPWLFFVRQPQLALQYAADSSRTTHGVVTAVDAYRYIAALINGALNGIQKTVLLSEMYSPIQVCWDTAPLVPEIDAIALGLFKHKQPPAIRDSGYVIRTMEAALWAFAHFEAFREGFLRSANLGDDVDTTAAVYGQIAGAYDGLYRHTGRMVRKNCHANAY